MNQQEAIAYFQAQTVAANYELQGMIAANVEYRMNFTGPRQEYSAPFSKKDFDEVPNKYGLHHNAVMGLFQQSNY
jgi:hypothetical protein